MNEWKSGFTITGKPANFNAGQKLISQEKGKGSAAKLWRGRERSARVRRKDGRPEPVVLCSKYMVPPAKMGNFLYWGAHPDVAKIYF
jgi:hypothetical protein